MKFIDLFDHVEDFRDKTKIKYEFKDILCLFFIANARSEKNVSCLGLHDHLVVYKEEYEEMELIKDGQIPSHDTILRILTMVDPASMENALTKYLNEILTKIASADSNSYSHTSIDGKAVKGTGRVETDKKEAIRNVQILNIYNNTTAVCMHSETISDKANEIPVAQELLKNMELRKVVVTFDALHTQKETCSIIHSRKGFYVAPLKNNQQALADDLKVKFDSEKQTPIHIQQNDREYFFLQKPAHYGDNGFAGFKTFVKMVSYKRKKPITMYFISNLSIKKTDLIMEAIENRWEIENDLHRDRDGFMNEDSIVLTSKTAVLNLAIMNNFAVAAARLYSVLTKEELRVSKKRMKSHPEKVVAYLLNVLGNEEVVKQICEIARRKRKESAAKQTI